MSIVGVARERQLELVGRLVEPSREGRDQLDAAGHARQRLVVVRLHRADLERWSYLSSPRRDKLGTLLGVTRSPLGPAALTLAGEVLQDAREGR